MIRRRVRIHGRVQGVFFRGTCQDRARELGVTGWVRNEPDGSVLAVFEGAPEAVEQMCQWCRYGPELAQVRRVDVDSEEPTGLQSFDVA